MEYVAFIIGIVLAVAAGMAMANRRRSRRRSEIFERPFPPEWADILRRNLPLYSRMPEPLRRDLEGHVNVFVAEKNFEGCGGLEMTDEVRITVAAEACMLLLGRPARYYPRLVSILVYPTAYLSKHYSRVGNSWIERETVLAGESWANSAVVVAWDGILHTAENPSKGHNVAVHEFAHQLDSEDGRADGVPVLPHGSSYSAWARVMLDEFERLSWAVKRGKPTFLDGYGATNHAEFFAVVSEAFFEHPCDLKTLKPDLYAQLMQYYRVDPAEWLM